VADARRTFDLSLVTPDGAAFEGEAEMIIVPGDAGEIGVLARHAPLVAMLRAGSTRIHVPGGEVHEFATGPGFFKVEQAGRAPARGGAGRARARRARRVGRRPLAARAADPPRGEPAERRHRERRGSDPAEGSARRLTLRVG
jgi:F-type H+-transporting ATPase subunit epsilon